MALHPGIVKGRFPLHARYQKRRWSSSTKEPAERFLALNADGWSEWQIFTHLQFSLMAYRQKLKCDKKVDFVPFNKAFRLTT